jgi:hypothetical protein
VNTKHAIEALDSINEQRIFVCEKLLGFLKAVNAPHGDFWYWPQGYPTVSSRPYAEFHELPPLTLDWLHECEGKLPALDKGGSSNTKDYATCRYASALARIVGVGYSRVAVVSGLKDKDGKPLLLETSVYSNPFEPWKIINANAEQRLAALVETLKQSPHP